MPEHAAMVNLIGGVATTEEILAIPGTSAQFYGKTPRPGRKVAHMNIVAPTREQLLERVTRAQAIAHRVNRLA